MQFVTAGKKKITWLKLARHTIDYAVAVAAAVLCSYWIVWGPW